MDKIKVLILAVPGDERDYVVETLSNIEYISIAGEVDTEIETRNILDSRTVDVLLLGHQAENSTYEISEKISLEYPDLAIIILEDNLDKDNIHKTIFSGAKDLLIRPVSPSNLIDSIYKSNQLMKERITVHKEVTGKIKRKRVQGQVFTVYSPKGGVGKTFFSINLATSLTKQSSKKVVLVDLDLELGNVGLAINLQPKFTLSDIIDDIRNIDQDYIESFLTIHESGLRVLPVNVQPMSSEFIKREHIDLIVRTLSSCFDYVVIDMPGSINSIIEPALSNANYLFLIATPEVSTVRNLKSTLITLSELNYPKSKIKIILNKDGNSEVKAKDIEKTLNSSIFYALKDDYNHVVTSVNVGIPYVMKYPSRPLTKQFTNLTDKIIKN